LNLPAAMAARLSVAGDGEGVLVLARHLPLRRHLLGGEAHAVGDADVLVLLEHRRVERDLVAHHGRHHAHRLGAGGDHHVGLAEADAVGGERHGLHAGGAEAVDGHARHALRQAGQQQADAGDVHALLGFRHGAADDDVADQLRVEAGRARHDVADDVGQHVVGAHVPQRAADLADRGARGGDDVGVLYLFAHLGSP
jgi:hypothetical protein